jgi:hypothetical protein
MLFRTQEELIGHVSQLMEANGWQKEWVNISTAGTCLIRWHKGLQEFTMSLEDMTTAGVQTPDVSDLFVD